MGGKRERGNGSRESPGKPPPGRRVRPDDARGDHRVGAQVLDLPLHVCDRLLRDRGDGGVRHALRPVPVRGRGRPVLPPAGGHAPPRLDDQLQDGANPRQAHMPPVAGTINYKMAPVLVRIYEQMLEPKWVVAMGACASSGGFYNNYSVLQGIDKIIPVDVYIPGAPPNPEGIIDAVVAIQKLLTTGAPRAAERWPIKI